MKKSPFWVAITLVTFAVSCKKSDPDPAPPAAEKFMTFTAGSTWNYKTTDNIAASNTNYTITATNTDTAINGRSYKIFTNNSGGPNEYYNITGADYYTFRTLPASLGGTSVEVLYLKDNLAAGETWTQTTTINVSGFNLTLTLNNKIAQKGINKTVNGIAYTGVTDVETTLAIAGIPIPYTLTSDIHYYYAPKIGQIENKTKINFSVTGFPANNFDQKTELQSSTIL
jgi:hypothetical protein